MQSVTTEASVNPIGSSKAEMTLQSRPEPRQGSRPLHPHTCCRVPQGKRHALRWVRSPKSRAISKEGLSCEPTAPNTGGITSEGCWGSPLQHLLHSHFRANSKKSETEISTPCVYYSIDFSFNCLKLYFKEECFNWPIISPINPITKSSFRSFEALRWRCHPLLLCHLNQMNFIRFLSHHPSEHLPVCSCICLPLLGVPLPFVYLHT